MTNAKAVLANFDLNGLTPAQINKLLGPSAGNNSHENIMALQKAFNGIEIKRDKSKLEIVTAKNPKIFGEDLKIQAVQTAKVLRNLRRNFIEKKKIFGAAELQKTIESVKAGEETANHVRRSVGRGFKKSQAMYVGVMIKDKDFIRQLKQPEIVAALMDNYKVSFESGRTEDKIKVYARSRKSDIVSAAKVIEHAQTVYLQSRASVKTVRVGDFMHAIENLKNNLPVDYKESKTAASTPAVQDKFKTDAYRITTYTADIYPKDATQAEAVTALRRKKAYTFLTGKAASGKTFLGAAHAVGELRSGKIDKIILTRPMVEAGENMGFLPGGIGEKLDPYLRPLYDTLEELMPVQQLADYMMKGKIKILPLAYMRGTTIKKSIILMDEAQNATDLQMKMFMSRIGADAQAIIIGDTAQNDREDNKSGLGKAMVVMRNSKNAEVVECTGNYRHPAVEEALSLYEAYEQNSEDLSVVSRKEARDKEIMMLAAQTAAAMFVQMNNNNGAPSTVSPHVA